MRQLLMAVALAAVAGVVGYADEDKKEEKKDAGFPELRKEFMAKYTGAKGDKDAQMSAFKQYAPKFLELAEKSGKDGFDALVFGINIGSMGASPEVKTRAIALLKKDHLENPKLVSVLPMVAGMGKPATPLLKELMDKGANDKLKAAACSALIEGMERSLPEAKGEEAAAIRKEMVELRKVAVDTFKMKDLFIGATLPDLKSEDLNGKAVKLCDY
jgi:hypothetical protein